MRYTTRIALALGFVGIVAYAGVSFGQVGAVGPAGEPAAASDGDVVRAPMPGFGGDRAFAGMLFRAVTAEVKVQTDDGFATRRIDTGEVTSVGDGSLTITRADGVEVTATPDGDTRISRDRDRVSLEDLREGDHAAVIRLDEGDGFVVKAILALSPEAYADAKTGLEERRAHWRDRRGELRERFRRWWSERRSGERAA